ncbi:MAG: hypothetical protein ABS944_16155 [Solibacillus sp.]|uniref:hypothetical protein n=1 Tax=Solibacillus sp. TaxID=1909654 RepID=UPI00331598AB
MTTVPLISLAAFLGYLSEDTPAVSKPVRVLGNDANEYLLKTQMAYDESSMSYINLNNSFINEFIAYCIGVHIGLPQPSIAITNVQKDFLDDNPTLVFNNRFKVGPHFSSQYIEDSERNLMQDYALLIEAGKKHLRKPWPKFFGSLLNSEDVPLIIAFDFFIANKDRFAHPDNYLLIGNDSNSHTILAIDHGHAFGSPFWDIEKQTYLHNAMNYSMEEYCKWFVNQFVLYNQRQLRGNIFNLNGFGDIFKALDQHIDLTDINNHSFIEPMERINSITPNHIENWLNQIPKEWYVDEVNQRVFYRNFIMHQIQALPHIIQYVAFTRGFENYTGGILKWKGQNTGTQ